MGNVTTTDLEAIDNSSTVLQINNNIQRLRDEFDKVVYKDGREELTGNLDANGKRIINLPDASTNSEPVTLGQIGSAISVPDVAAEALLRIAGDSARPTSATLAGSTGSSLIGFIQTDTGAVLRTGQDKLRDALDAKDFGCVLDGVTDDTVNMQKAIDACLAASPARALRVTGPAMLTGTLYITRLVDTANDIFDIICDGNKAGFTAASSLTFFDTTTADLSDGAGEFAPSSEYIRFHNTRFSVTDAAVSGGAVGNVLSKKMLRVMFSFCTFYKIRCMTSTLYAQEIKGVGCNVLRWPGTFFSSEGAYAIQWTNTKFQFSGGDAFDLGDANLTRGVIGCSFHQCEIEGNGGGFFKGESIVGLSLVGNYVEANQGKFLTVVGNNSRGITVIGNAIYSTTANKAVSSFYEIDWGASGQDAFFSAGNFCDGRLHDDSNMTVGALQHFDNALLQTVRSNTLPIAIERARSRVQSPVTAGPGGGLVNAIAITAPFVYIATVATTNDSIKLPAAVPGVEIKIANLAPNAVGVWCIGSDVIIGAGGSYSQPSAVESTYTCYNAGVWVKGNITV